MSLELTKTALTNFIKEILDTPLNVNDGIQSITTYDYAVEVIKTYLTDDVLSAIQVETGGHNGLESFMTLGEINDYYTSLGVTWNHHLSYENVRYAFERATTVAMSLVITPDKDKPVTFDKIAELFKRTTSLEAFECDCCGHTTRLMVDLIDASVAARPDAKGINCPARELLPETFEFTAPSGKIVVANDLRSIIPGELLNYQESGYSEYHDIKATYFTKRDAGRVSINSILGQLANRDFHLQENKLVYLQAGNSSPNIFSGEGFFQIGRDFDCETDEPTDGLDLKDHGFICTDVWAVNMMDYNVFCQYVRDMGNDPEDVLKDLDAMVLDVPETNMMITDYYATTVIDDDRPKVIARLDFQPEPSNENSLKVGL